ncbi:MAG: hypothetical protein ACRECH_18550 [Nitrososphaerales archaeon]
MSFNEIVLAAGGLGVGVAAGAIGVYFYARKSFRKNETIAADTSAPHVNFEDIDDRAIQRLIPKPQLEKTRRELRTLTLEKDLVSAALTRLYEAEAAHEITREERETLGLKYREELKALDEKILKIDSFIEVGDLETLREQLLDLVAKKIEAIEKRIDRARVSSGPLLTEITKSIPQSKPEPVIVKNEPPKTRIPDISNLLVTNPEGVEGSERSTSSVSTETTVEAPEAKISDEKSNPRKKTSDAQVDQLQKELLEALDRLERLDIEN